MSMYANLGQVMPRGAAKYGDRVALVFHGEEFTYNRLDELTARLANGLTGLGVSQGDRVTLYSPNRWEWIVSYYAVLRVGAVINPINVMLTPEEVDLRGQGLWRQGLARLGRQGQSDRQPPVGNAARAHRRLRRRYS